MKEVLLSFFVNFGFLFCFSVCLTGMGVYEILGTVRYRLKDYEGAVRDLQACVLVDSSNKLAYNYLVRVFIRIGCSSTILGLILCLV